METISGNFTGGWSGGFLMSCIALSIVFLVIAGLMFVMMALKHISKTIEVLRTEGAGEPHMDAPLISADPPSEASVPAMGVSRADPDEGELAAVITASIMAMSGRNIAVRGFTPAAAPARGSGLSAWRMASIFHNSRGFRD